jgi:nitrate reductase NapE component
MVVMTNIAPFQAAWERKPKRNFLLKIFLPSLAMPSKPSDRIQIDEVLPPKTPGGQAAKLAQESEVSRFLAKWLDNWLRIPGTQFKIGLDPILALFPGIGSTVASGGGLIILVEAVRSGVSLPVLVRMGGNMLVNTFFDYIPLGGPVASAFFKSNMRNLRLLQSWQAGQQQAVRKSTFRVFIFVAFLALLLVGMIIGLFTFYVWLLRETGLVN